MESCFGIRRICQKLVANLVAELFESSVKLIVLLIVFIMLTSWQQSKVCHVDHSLVVLMLNLNC